MAAAGAIPPRYSVSSAEPANESAAEIISTSTSLAASNAATFFSISTGEGHEIIGRDPGEVDLQQLYPAGPELDTDLSRALGMLSQCLARLDNGITAFRGGDKIAADDEVHHLLVLTDELFCLRHLSDGFGNIVDACGNALRNKNGDMLTEQQLLAVNSSLLALKKRPFLSFDSSLDIIDRLEAAGLDVESAETNELVNALADEGVC